jgi:PKD repeat protein
MGRIRAIGGRNRVLLGLIAVAALALSACLPARPIPPPSPPEAAFSVSTAPMVASFTDQSTGSIKDRSWDFGDGQTSTDTSPTHTYAAHGDYLVTLTVTGPGGTDTASQNVTIKPPAPVASFVAEPPSGTIPLTVSFANTSTGFVDAVAWDLDGDGVFDDGTGQTATRTFDAPGSHTVGLSITGPGGTSTTSQTVLATLPPAPVASFTATPGSGVAPVTVQFIDTSTGIISSRDWDFDADGLSDDTSPNPSRVFDAPGNHQVFLTVTGPGGSSTTSQTITVNANTPPVINITAPTNGASVMGGTTVTFSGTANDAEDGNISSSIQWTSSLSGPLGTGASIQVGNIAAGAYVITASVIDTGGVAASASINITVTPAPPPLNVVFNASPTAGIAPLLVNFNACASTGTSLSFRWDFDNDGVDDQVGPCQVSHTYQAPGSYTAELTVVESVAGGGQVTTTKQILVLPPSDPGDPGGDPCPRRCEPPPGDDEPPPGLP